MLLPSQTTLAELKLEVGAAQQLSSRAAKQLPKGDKAGCREHMQWDPYSSSFAIRPRISSNMSTDGGGTSVLRQIALMRQLQESLAAHTTRMAAVEGASHSIATFPLMHLMGSYMAI